jgi:hypothetical protein
LQQRPRGIERLLEIGGKGSTGNAAVLEKQRAEIAGEFGPF